MTPRDPHPERFAPPQRGTGEGPPHPVAEVHHRARAVIAAQRPRPSQEHPQPDRGEVFAEIPRRDGTVLVVSKRVYEGHPFVSIAPWRDGWPVKGKGVSVRLHEVSAVLAALVEIAERDARDGAP